VLYFPSLPCFILPFFTDVVGLRWCPSNRLKNLSLNGRYSRGWEMRVVVLSASSTRVLAKHLDARGLSNGHAELVTLHLLLLSLVVSIRAGGRAQPILQRSCCLGPSNRRIRLDAVEFQPSSKRPDQRSHDVDSCRKREKACGYDGISLRLRLVHIIALINSIFTCSGLLLTMRETLEPSLSNRKFCVQCLLRSPHHRRVNLSHRPWPRYPIHKAKIRHHGF
jgi:hypothetical protein